MYTPRVIIKIKDDGRSHHTEIGDLGVSSLGLDTLERAIEWRLAKGIEIDLYYQGIKNILETLKSI